MEQEPDYKELYQHAQLEMQNLRNQLDHWEMKGTLLRQMADEQEAFATEIEVKIELIKIRAFNMKKLGLA